MLTPQSCRAPGHLVTGTMPPTGKSLRRSLMERFYDHAVMPENIWSECWTWDGYRGNDGRARLSVQRQNCPAATVCYTLHYGPVPEGLIVCHDCNNGHLGCVNPFHLRADTWDSNAQDRVRVGNHATQKLSVADVHAIRARLDAGEKGIRLAEEYGVSKTAISRIKLGKTFANL